MSFGMQFEDRNDLLQTYRVAHLLRERVMLTAIRILRLGGLEDLYMYRMNKNKALHDNIFYEALVEKLLV